MELIYTIWILLIRLTVVPNCENGSALGSYDRMATTANHAPANSQVQACLNGHMVASLTAC